MPNIHEIESFAYPSSQLKPKRRPKNRWILPALIVVILLGLAFWVISAKAKTIELRDCRTNEECERIYCSGEAMNYVQDKSICHD